MKKNKTLLSLATLILSLFIFELALGVSSRRSPRSPKYPNLPLKENMYESDPKGFNYDDPCEGVSNCKELEMKGDSILFGVVKPDKDLIISYYLPGEINRTERVINDGEVVFFKLRYWVFNKWGPAIQNPALCNNNNPPLACWNSIQPVFVNPLIMIERSTLGSDHTLDPLNFAHDDTQNHGYTLQTHPALIDLDDGAVISSEAFLFTSGDIQDACGQNPYPCNTFSIQDHKIDIYKNMYLSAENGIPNGPPPELQDLYLYAMMFGDVAPFDAEFPYNKEPFQGSLNETIDIDNQYHSNILHLFGFEADYMGNPEVPEKFNAVGTQVVNKFEGNTLLLYWQYGENI